MPRCVRCERALSRVPVRKGAVVLLRFLSVSLALPLLLSAGRVRADEVGLSVLVPFDLLPSTIVQDFDRASGRRTRTGFLSSPDDTNFLVRQSSTLWDVVISAETELRKLASQDRLQPLRSSDQAASESGQSGGSPKTGQSQMMLSLFQDPVGLACKLPSHPASQQETPLSPGREDAALASWEGLGPQLVSNGLLGEIVLALPLAAQLVLARALARAELIASGERYPLAHPSSGAGIEESWLLRLHWQSRAPRVSLQSEMMSPQVSCLITYLSVYMRLLPFFSEPASGSSQTEKKSSVGGESKPKSRDLSGAGTYEFRDRLVFLIPGKKTVVRRIGIGITAETTRLALARRFVGELAKRKREVADHAGLCAGTEGPGSLGLCGFERLGSFPESAQISEDLKDRLEKSLIRPLQ